MKICFTCKRELDEKEFYRNRKSEDGLMYKCKTCTYIKVLPQKTAEWHLKGAKPCKRCGVEKPFDQFKVNKQALLGLDYLCKECFAARSLEQLAEEDRERVKEWRWRVEKQRLGLCISCGQEKADGTKKRCVECSLKRAASKQQKMAVWKKSGLCTLCGKVRDGDQKRCEKCLDIGRAKRKRTKLRDKLIFLETYGNECVCCGENNLFFLTADHINRDGYKDRVKNHYRRYVREKREDIRILCFNCNCGRELNNGICPHEENKRV